MSFIMIIYYLINFCNFGFYLFIWSIIFQSPLYFIFNFFYLFLKNILSKLFVLVLMLLCVYSFILSISIFNYSPKEGTAIVFLFIFKIIIISSIYITLQHKKSNLPLLFFIYTKVFFFQVEFFTKYIIFFFFSFYK